MQSFQLVRLLYLTCSWNISEVLEVVECFVGPVELFFVQCIILDRLIEEVDILLEATVLIDRNTEKDVVTIGEDSRDRNDNIEVLSVFG